MCVECMPGLQTASQARKDVALQISVYEKDAYVKSHHVCKAEQHRASCQYGKHTSDTREQVG
jgi:hypothetical protein